MHMPIPPSADYVCTFACSHKIPIFHNSRWIRPMPRHWQWSPFKHYHKIPATNIITYFPKRDARLVITQLIMCRFEFALWTRQITWVFFGSVADVILIVAGLGRCFLRNSLAALVRGDYGRGKWESRTSNLALARPISSSLYWYLRLL